LSEKLILPSIKTIPPVPGIRPGLGNCLKNRLTHKIFSALLAGLLITGCATSVQILPLDQTEKISCRYPFNPENIPALLIFYKDGMRYVTQANDTCRNAFANELKKNVLSSILITGGCTQITLDDIEDARSNPEKLNQRLHYY
jgi:hypothetical protein